MIPKKIDLIEIADIELLVTNGVREGKTIEYKQELPSGKDEDKKEFLADVSSFANAAGGDLLYGVIEQRDSNEKPTGIPRDVSGLNGVNADQVTRQFENSIRDGIAPRIPNVQIREVPGGTSGPVLLIRVPRSFAAPHMVTFKGSSRFFSRTNAGKCPLDVNEIRAAFVQSETLPERIRQFREVRLGKILAGETPIPSVDGPTMVIHVVPVATFLSLSAIDIANVDRSGPLMTPIIRNEDYTHRINLDGCLSFAASPTDKKLASSYRQLFRNGVIEDASTNFFHNQGDGNSFHTAGYEKIVKDVVKSGLQLLSHCQIEPPFVILNTLLNVRGFRIPDNFAHFPSGQRPSPVDRNHLIFPEIVLDTAETNLLFTLLLPLFDMLWQACGYERCFNYDADGNRVPGL